MSTTPTPLPTDPCQLLAMAQDAYFRLMTGGATAEIESPQLGRVVFNKADIGNLRMFIDDLKGQCAQASGQALPGQQSRRPVSVEEYAPRGPRRWPV